MKTFYTIWPACMFYSFSSQQQQLMKARPNNVLHSSSYFTSILMIVLLCAETTMSLYDADFSLHVYNLKVNLTCIFIVFQISSSALIIGMLQPGSHDPWSHGPFKILTEERD